MVSVVALTLFLATNLASPAPRPVIARDQSRPTQLVKTELGLLPAVLPRPDGSGKTRMDGECFIAYDCFHGECVISEGCTDGNPLTCCECVGCEYNPRGCGDCPVPCGSAPC
jgi:hypothetical protein